MIDVHVLVFAAGRSGPQKGFFNRMDFTFDVDNEQQYMAVQEALHQAGQGLGEAAAAANAPSGTPERKDK